MIHHEYFASSQLFCNKTTATLELDLVTAYSKSTLLSSLYIIMVTNEKMCLDVF